jgi:hypothetical protein
MCGPRRAHGRGVLFPVEKFGSPGCGCHLAAVKHLILMLQPTARFYFSYCFYYATA